MRDHPNLAADNSAQIIVDAAGMKAFQRGRIGRDIEGMDLPRPVAPACVALEEAVDDDEGEVWRIAGLDDLLMAPSPFSSTTARESSGARSPRRNK
jgi:hypothetical protein